MLLVMTAQAPAAPADEEAPPAAFLEFLGEWEDERGDWQDPLDFEGPQWQALDDIEGQNDE